MKNSAASINPAAPEKITAFLKSEAEFLEQATAETRRALTQGITQAYLHRLNQYALENGLITEDIYRKMAVSIQTSYNETRKRLEI